MPSDGATKTDSAPVPPSWAANRFKQTKGDRSITFVQFRLIHKMTSILVPVGFRKYSKNSEHSNIYSVTHDLVGSCFYFDPLRPKKPLFVCSNTITDG